VTIEQIKEQFYFREQSLSNFEQQADSRDLQLFQALKMNFSPLAYGDVLDRLLKQSYPGTSDWLMKSKVFKHWLDISNRSTSLLWLKGIPGAGKTFLSGAAIEEAKTRHQTIFAFATYVNQNTTTAKSVLHSLLFQLADNNKFIRSSLVESSKQDLDSTKYVSQVFKTLLASIGPIYIIVDGLDEMEALERGILLQQLTSMTECPEVKILVSSRPEDDIANILETKSKNIRIDDNNGQGIRLYIKQKVEEWMEVAKFSREARGKIERLLIPIVANSNGSVTDGSRCRWTLLTIVFSKLLRDVSICSPCFR
jgi:Cdc6-like AAA superfamily ATPase